MHAEGVYTEARSDPETCSLALIKCNNAAYRMNSVQIPVQCCLKMDAYVVLT